jgi:enoyl-[acyl-carrier protein] reductase III
MEVARATADLTGQRALVTGGSRGIGAVIARRLAAAGAHVFINYARSEAAARDTVAAIESAGGAASLAPANLADADALASMMTSVAADGLDVLVHNAAIGSFKPFHAVRANQWDLTLNVNARALLLCTQAAAPALAARGGRVVAISSLGGRRVVPHYGAIGVSKAALEAATRYLASELAPRGIRVNGIAAGLVETASVKLHPAYETLAAAALARTPTGRLVTADAIADLVLFLCGPHAADIVGQTIVIDGGASLLA